MPWHALISIQVMLVAIATIITRLLARDKKIAKSGLVITAGWFCVLYLFGLLALPTIGGTDPSSLSHYLGYFIGGGLAFALSNVLLFYALSYLDAAVATILGTVSVIFTIFGSWVLLHENLTNIQILGTCLLLISIIYGVLATRHRRNKAAHLNLAIGGAYALGSAVFYAVAAINEKFLLNHISTGSYILFGWGIQAIAASCLALLIEPKALKFLAEPKVLGWTICLGLLRGASGLCFILSLVKSNNVGLVTTISNFKLIIITLLGAWLLHERKRMTQKLISALGATVALAMLFWR